MRDYDCIFAFIFSLSLGIATAAGAAEGAGVGSISCALWVLLDPDFALALGSTGITSVSSSLMLLDLDLALALGSGTVSQLIGDWDFSLGVEISTIIGTSGFSIGGGLGFGIIFGWGASVGLYF